MAKTLADVLDRMAAIAQSVMDGGAPSDENHDCPMCLLKASGTDEHDPDCGYRIARHMSQADVNEVRRLARVLRYDGSPRAGAGSPASAGSRTDAGRASAG